MKNDSKQGRLACVTEKLRLPAFVAGCALAFFLSAAMNCRAASTNTVAMAQSYLDQFPLHQQTKYFEFHFKRNPERIEAIARFADAFVAVISRDFFKAEFDYPIRVLVLEDRPSFQEFLRRHLRVPQPPNWGIYLSAEKMFVTYEESGLGTFAHEIMHPLVERNLSDSPLWAREGIPSFFEKFYGYWNNDKLVVRWGFQNPWRIEMLGTNLMHLNLKQILRTRNPQGDYRESDLRMVSMFLWQQGKFKRFIELIKKRQTRGYASYVEAAFEMPVERIVPMWERYLAEVAEQRNETMRLPASEILRDEATFQRFCKFYGIADDNNAGSTIGH